MTAITNVTESSISIAWDAPFLGGEASTINEYIVRVSPNEGDPPNVQGTSAKITGLTSNEEYTISVAAMASDGRSGAALERLTCTRKEYLRACIFNKFYYAMLGIKFVVI